MELLLAVSLMGLVVSLAFPRFGAVKDAYFAKEEAKGITNTVQAARIAAIRNRTTVALTTSGDREGRLQTRRLSDTLWGMGDSARSGRSVENWESVWEAPVIHRYEVSGSLTLKAPRPGIAFFPNGTSTGGEILVTDEDGNLLSHLRVEPGTGELYWQ